MTLLYVAPRPLAPAADAVPRRVGLQYHHRLMSPSCWFHHPLLISFHVRQMMTFPCPYVSALYGCDRNGSRQCDLARPGMGRHTGPGRNGRDLGDGGNSLHRSGPCRQSRLGQTQGQWRAAVVLRPDKFGPCRDWCESGPHYLATLPRSLSAGPGEAVPALWCLCPEFRPARSNHCQKQRSEEVTFHHWTIPSSPVMPPVNKNIAKHCKLSTLSL